ncbi:9372_t:CDS:1, partial [Cetraspora pellucida]
NGFEKFNDKEEKDPNQGLAKLRKNNYEKNYITEINSKEILN